MRKSKWYDDYICDVHMDGSVSIYRNTETDLYLGIKKIDKEEIIGHTCADEFEIQMKVGGEYIPKYPKDGEQQIYVSYARSKCCNLLKLCGDYLDNAGSIWAKSRKDSFHYADDKINEHYYGDWSHDGELGTRIFQYYICPVCKNLYDEDQVVVNTDTFGRKSVKVSNPNELTMKDIKKSYLNLKGKDVKWLRDNKEYLKSIYVDHADDAGRDSDTCMNASETELSVQEQHIMGTKNKRTGKHNSIIFKALRYSTKIANERLDAVCSELHEDDYSYFKELLGVGTLDATIKGAIPEYNGHAKYNSKSKQMEGYSYWEYTLDILSEYNLKFNNISINDYITRINNGFIVTSYKRNNLWYPAPFGDLRDEPLKIQKDHIIKNTNISNISLKTDDSGNIYYNIKAMPIGLNTHIPNSDYKTFICFGIPRPFKFYTGYDNKYDNKIKEVLDVTDIKRITSITTGRI